MNVKPYQSILDEGKQVGILYHYTGIDSLEKILRSGRLRASTTDKMQLNPEEESLGYVSFSRSPFLGKGNLFGLFRMVFDGDKLSNRYRFEQYLMKGDNHTDTYSKRRYGAEAEERVFGNVLLKDGLKSIQYKIQPRELNMSKREMDNNPFFIRLRKIEKLLAKKGIDFDIVEKWEPVR